ncbi:Mog interacting and ectopic p-granules protein 1 [Gryllus bimaculatus]|nr:Mog interacting and ectopic p-granules protein 1 [Gryllus bimaculatus]
MDASNAMESNCEMKREILNDENYKDLPTDEFLLSNDTIHHVEINNSGEPMSDKVPDNDTNSIDEVPSNLSASVVDAVTKSDCQEYTECEDATYIVPDSPHNSLFSKINTNLNDASEEVNNIDSGICEDSDSHCDVLSTEGGNAEEVLPDISETCELGSVQQSSYQNITSKRKFDVEGNSELGETAFTDSLSTDSPGDLLSIKEEGELHLQNEDSELSIKDRCRESDGIVVNSDSICADEKDKNCDLRKAKDSKCVDETVVSVRKNIERQDALTCNPASARKGFSSVSEVENPVLYRCINCSFTNAQLEKVSSHVLTCPKKRKQEQIQVSDKGEPPSKVSLLEQRLVLPTKFTTASKPQSVILSRSQVPITSKTQLVITPQSRLLPSPQLRISTAPKTHINTLQPAQYVLSSPTPQTAMNKTVFAIAPKLVSTSKSQVIINPQTQRHVSSQPQVSIKKQNLVLKPQVSISPQTQLSSSLKASPVLTLQTPFMSTAQLSSVSQSQIATSSQLPLTSGTKVTLGPHSQVPIVPQAPLTLPQQGLTIAQAGTQLLITTKPVQQSAGVSNQPTLLGLGIGTNPALAPNNIVLLPNVLLNSIAPSTGKVNGKQAPAVQRQLILQATPTTTTTSSIAPIQLQNNNVNISQSHILMPPLFTVSNNPGSTGGIKTTVSNIVQKSKLPVSSSPNSTSSVKPAPASTTNTKLIELSNQVNTSLDKFICEICDDSVKDLEKLRSHMKCLHEINIHPKVVPSFSCQKCQFSFFTEQGLERHLVGSHGLVTAGLQEAADKGKDGGRCPICGWGYQNKLLDHVATEHKVCLKPADLTYKCTICTATFGVYKRFEDHVYSVHRPPISKLTEGNSKSSSRGIK